MPRTAIAQMCVGSIETSHSLIRQGTEFQSMLWSECLCSSKPYVEILTSEEMALEVGPLGGS